MARFEGCSHSELDQLSSNLPAQNKASAAASPSLSTSSAISSPSLLTECRSLQQDELIALESIYTSRDQFAVLNRSQTQEAEPIRLRLSIPISFSPRHVRVTTISNTRLSKREVEPQAASLVDHAASIAPTQEAGAHSTSTTSQVASSRNKRPFPSRRGLGKMVSASSHQSEFLEGRTGSVDSPLAEESEWSAHSPPERATEVKSTDVDALDSTTEIKMGKHGKSTGKRGSESNASKKGAASAPWEMRAQAFAKCSSLAPTSSSIASKGVMEKAPNPLRSDSTSSSSPASPNATQPSSSDVKKALNPNARPFSSSPLASMASVSRSINPAADPSQDSNFFCPVEQPSTSPAESPHQHTRRLTSTCELLKISNLPSITLYLSLPPSYPLESPPTILSLASPYLSEQLHVPSQHAEWIKKKLLALWCQSKSEILWSWGEFLSEGIWNDTFANPFFRDDEDADINGKPIINLHESDISWDVSTSGSTAVPSLAETIREFDRAAQSKSFSTLTFTCSICLESRRGSKCFRIKSCSHVFCSDCLKDYFSMMILEGFHLQASRCPDVECVKRSVLEADEEVERKSRVGPDQEDAAEEKLLNPGNESVPLGRISSEELLELLGPTLHSRYLWLIKKSLLESNPTASSCPRQGCDGISIRRKEDNGTRFENFRSCQICTFNWCTFCKKTWHGLTPCKLKNSSELVDEFLKHPEGSFEREKMYKKFGRKNLDRLITEVIEEKANAEWFDGNATNCPSCQVRIEKSAGCNHMTCFCCHSHFCYLCQSRLNPREPYRHFNTPNTPCFQKLFEGALPLGMGADGQMVPGLEGIAMQGPEEEDDLDELNFPARLIQEMMRDL